MPALLESLTPVVHVGTLTRMQALPAGGVERFLRDNAAENLYFVEGVAAAAAAKPRVGDDDIAAKGHFAIDVDYRKYHEGCPDDEIRQAGAAIVNALDGHPQLGLWRQIVFSGNGIHVHYVGKAVPITHKDLWADGVRAVQREFIKTAGFEREVDRACVNASRIFRIPGSVNRKGDRVIQTEVLYDQPDAAFDMALIQALGKREQENRTLQEASRDLKLSLVRATSGKLYDLCSAKPIRDIVLSFFPSWDSDGRNFWEKVKGPREKAACFIPPGENFLVHGGTRHIPDQARGYGTFEFVRVMTGRTNGETFDWFCERYPDARELRASERRQRTGGKDWSSSFITWSDLVDRAKARHGGMSPAKVCTFGVPAVDSALGGIFPSDLVVIGARTGMGKSEFLLHLGHANAAKGKRVVYYQLEMDEEDPVDRRVHGRMNALASRRHIDFIDAKQFRMNVLTTPQQALCAEAFDAERSLGGNLVVYVGDSLNFESFLQSLEAVRATQVDLIILDHLHYFSMDEGESMTESLGKVMRSIRVTTKKYKIPIVVVSQLRKAAMFGAEPTIDDLHGSGDIAKEATSVLLLHRPDKARTQVLVAKSRHFGTSDFRIGLRFDPVLRTYEADGRPSDDPRLPKKKSPKTFDNGSQESKIG